MDADERTNNVSVLKRKKPVASIETMPNKKHACPRTTAMSPGKKTKRQNLTNHDWERVYQFCDAHPNVTTRDVAKHFRVSRKNVVEAMLMKEQSLQHGRLEFDHTTLTRNLKPEKRAER